MVKFEIDNKHYEISDRLTVEQWVEIMKWDFEHIAHWPKIVAAATGVPSEKLEEVSEESLEIAIVFVAAVINQRRQTEIRDFDTILFGEWIDLDIYLNYGAEKHMEDILKILSPETEWADEALWVIEKYSEWRLFIYKQYKTLFGLDVLPEDFEDTEEKPKDIAKSWYDVIIMLASEDILNMDAVTEQPLKQALNFMAWKKEKTLREQQAILKQKREYDLQRNRR